GGEFALAAAGVFTDAPSLPRCRESIHGACSLKQFRAGLQHPITSLLVSVRHSETDNQGWISDCQTKTIAVQLRYAETTRGRWGVAGAGGGRGAGAPRARGRVVC